MLRQSVLFGPQWFPAASGTTVQPAYQFDSADVSAGISNNYGLLDTQITTGGAANALGTKSSMGTAVVDLDGIQLSAWGASLRAYKFNIYLNGSATPVLANIPITCSPNNIGKVTLPIRIAAGTTIEVDAATSAASQSIRLLPLAFRRSLASTVTSIAGLGSAANVAAMGAGITVAKTWFAIGTLAVASKGIAIVHFGPNGNFSRTAGSGTSRAILDIGYGAAGAEQVLIPNAVMGLDFVNNLSSIESGPFLMDLPVGTRLVARARRTDDTFPQFYNAQLAMMY